MKKPPIAELLALSNQPLKDKVKESTIHGSEFAVDLTYREAIELQAYIQYLEDNQKR